MTLGLALLAIALAVYAQSGLPGLGLIELLFSVAKMEISSWVRSCRETGTGRNDIQGHVDNSRRGRYPGSPVKVDNRGAGTAETTINMNIYLNDADRHGLPVSDGGDLQEPEQDEEEDDSESED